MLDEYNERPGKDEPVIIGAVKDHKALYEAIVNYSDDAIISKTLDGIITSWNHGAEKIFGYKSGEVVGKHISLLVPESRLSEDENIIGQIRAGFEIDHYETERLRKDGKVIDISLSVSPLKDATGKVVGAAKIARDISPQKQAEAERLIAIADIAQRNRDLEQFAYIVSHNLRAPMANIMGIANLLINVDFPSEDRNSLLQSMAEATEKLDNTIKDLNSVTKLKISSSEIFENVDLNEIFEDIRYSFLEQIAKAKAHIVADFSEVSVIPSVKSYIHSIFYNLISNSIKYRQPDKTLVCEIRSYFSDGGCTLTFKDNGRGIDLEETGDRIFEMFKRFHTYAAEGKGMGLFMVKTHVQSLNGTITVESRLNEGSTFTIKLPGMSRR